MSCSFYGIVERVNNLFGIVSTFIFALVGSYFYNQIPVDYQYWFAFAIGGAAGITQVYINKFR